MASLEDELRDLKERNNDLVQKVQYWKMLAAQRENEKMDLMKEINELRLKLSRLRSNGTVQANNLDAALQSAAQKALAHLVRASSEIATTMELAKTYMRDREQLDYEAPRWNSIGGTPSTAKKDKVHRVPPLMIGGQSIQPVVALTMLDTSNARSAGRSSNASRNATDRALPMHMLQDVYIPLTRVDDDLATPNMDADDENNEDDSTELLQLNDNEEETINESQGMQEDDNFDSSRILDAVIEEGEETDSVTPPRVRIENPLEGPSWMLDAGNTDQSSALKSNLEPDSTTELEDFKNRPQNTERIETEGIEQLPVPSARASREFTPTVRRRKRTSSPPPAAATPRAPHYSPRPAARRLSNSGRVLKVLVAKMRFDTEGDSPETGAGASPPKRAASGAPLAASHAPSPNGATVAGVIVEENNQNGSEGVASGDPMPHHKHRHRHQHIFNSNDVEISEEHRINTERRTKSRDRNEQNKEPNERTNRRADSQERTNERANRRADSQERTNGRANRRADSQERTNGRANSAERTHYRQKPSHSRDRSNDGVRTDSRTSNDLSQDDNSGSACASRARAGSCDSDSGSGGERESRSRRPRKAVVYKEKPLNRKMRR